MKTSQSCVTLKTFSSILASAVLSSGSLNDGLALLRLYARLHWDNISGHFGNESLEESFFEKWADSSLKSTQPALPKADFLHIATQTHVQGGHSRLIWRLSAGLSGHGTQALLLTDARKGNHVAEFPGPVTRLKGKPSARAAAIVAAAQNAGTILLHTHPDDAAAAFAARVLWAQNKKILFVNHADHVFSLGPGAADVVLEICMTGWKTTRDRRAARTQSFMGIPIVDDDVASVSSHIAPRNGPIVSMGGPGKFRPTPGLSFPDFLMELLPHVANDVILIGPSHKDDWWADVTTAYPDRVHLRGPLPQGEVEDILKSASCYIDSFPLDGGTAYPQAAALGVPCFAPNASNASGVSPSEKLRFETVDALASALKTFLNGGAYPFDLGAVQKSLVQDFSNAAVAERVISAAQGNVVAPLDYLPPLGRRDSDYNARRWVDQHEIALPKRLWRDLSAGARLHLYLQIRRAALPEDIKSRISKELATRWV
ncbi:hypothetical protein [Roseovarius sp. M141]|uniref:hypothetical protein n=1 Tax=Roseovarius sp. M141 TaxID=2583806 RepID=UPI0020CDCD1C|nr:hypothetical protein [Roseovarius sp. M141]MCQ0091073.1 hypothetical protein [Roseovarius sp. M141]